MIPSTFQFLLVLNILAYAPLVQTHRAHAIAHGPKVHPVRPPFLKQIPVNADGTLALEEPDDKCHRELRRDAQAHVNVVRNAVTFHHFHPLLLAQVTQNRTDPLPQFPIDDPTTVFRYDYNVVLAFPSNMGQRIPVMHMVLLSCPSGPSRKENLRADSLNTTLERRSLPASHGRRPWFQTVVMANPISRFQTEPSNAMPPLKLAL